MDRQGLKRKYPTLYKFFRFAVVTRQALIHFYDLSYVREVYAALFGGFPTLSPGNRRLFSRMTKCAHDLAGGKEFLVIDVGANDGWFARSFFRFYSGPCRMISYEPLKSQHEKLDALKSKRRGSFEFFATAIGSSRGEMTINEYGSTGLSSLLPLVDSKIYPATDGYDTRVVAQYPVAVETLADEFQRLKIERRPTLLKIDTQGFEIEVLRGAETLFAAGMIDLVAIEVMTVRKYERQASAAEILTFLERFGFSIHTLYESYCDTKTGRLTELDFILTRA